MRLVLKERNRGESFSPGGLRVDRPVRSPLEPSGQVVEVGLQSLPVVLPGLAVDASDLAGVSA